MKLGKVVSAAILWALSTAGAASAATIIMDSAVSTGIPDNSSVSFNINISDAGAVSDVTVRFNMTHLQVGDIRVTLANPTGGIADVVYRLGGDTYNRNYGGLYEFNDGYAGNLWTATAALAGGTNAVAPPGNYFASTVAGAAVSLNALLGGSDVQGDWTLTVYDLRTNNNAGAIVNSWGLTIETASAPPAPPLPSVPEPSAYILFSLGLGGIAAIRRRRGDRTHRIS
jgi:subtilisin-like proprotein convertase family protein